MEASGLRVTLEREGEPGALPAAVGQAAYRIVQEALTNVTRHAWARTARVRLRFEDGVDVEVVDDGIGGTVEEGTGLSGMRRRAESLGGSFEAGGSPGGGFRVRAHIPGGPT